MEDDTPINSIIQVSPDAPRKLTLVTTPVLESMRGKGYGVAFKTAISGEQIELVGAMFVDDATYFQHAPQQSGRDSNRKDESSPNLSARTVMGNGRSSVSCQVVLVDVRLRVAGREAQTKTIQVHRRGHLNPGQKRGTDSVRKV